MENVKYASKHKYHVPSCNINGCIEFSFSKVGLNLFTTSSKKNHSKPIHYLEHVTLTLTFKLWRLFTKKAINTTRKKQCFALKTKI